MTPDCMTAAELALWNDANRRLTRAIKAKVPCRDCPLAFAREMRRDGCCNGEPGRGVDVTPFRHHQRGVRYATDAERIAARRATWRESSRRRVARARARRYTIPVGRSDESNTIALGARVSATTRDAGVIASIEVVAR